MKTFKIILSLLLAVVIIVALYFYFFSDQPIPVFEKEKQYSNEELIKMAQELFNRKKAEGLDMTNGPCLSNELVPGWVVDVVHDPRLPIDNQPENQCSAFRDGTASHFIELDTEGNLIQIK